MKISFKKNWLLLPAVVLVLNLFLATSVWAQTAGCTPSDDADFSSTVLNRGSKGPDVGALQQALNDEGANPALVVDCDFGTNTFNAVKSFQTANKIKVDGIAGPETLKALGFNVSYQCAVDSDCQSVGPGYKCDTNHGYTCIKPDTGTPGGGTTPGGGGGGVSVGGNCGGDPNLVWDSQAKICLPKGQECTKGSLACAGSLTELALMVINFLLIFSGIVAVGFIIIGGYWYITAAGNEEQSEKGKKALVNAIIGIVIVTLAFLIVKVVSNTLNSKNFGDKSTAFLSKVSQ